ncbi:MAG: hypothetical protein Q4C73_01085 [Eubacteriales bacterium]|nr:hypothetical protein [Eubacteriales bacterium]
MMSLTRPAAGGESCVAGFFFIIFPSEEWNIYNGNKKGQLLRHNAENGAVLFQCECSVFIISLLLKNSFNCLLSDQLICSVEKEAERSAVEPEVTDHLIVAFYIHLEVIAFYKYVAVKCVGRVDQK